MPKYENWESKPISELTYYILLAVIEPLHGYAVMKKVEEVSEGTVSIGPGTLYTLLSKLEKENLIRKVHQDERRKSYRLTDYGKDVLLSQFKRLEIMTKNGTRIKEWLSS